MADEIKIVELRVVLQGTDEEISAVIAKFQAMDEVANYDIISEEIAETSEEN